MLRKAKSFLSLLLMKLDLALHYHQYSLPGKNHAAKNKQDNLKICFQQ